VGLVKYLGKFDDPEELARRAREDSDTVALQVQQAEWIAARLSRTSRAWRLAGEQWHLTTFGHDALQVIH
jgi:hypothetical protein